MKFHQRIKRIGNNQGIALVVVLMVFVVSIILGTSAVSMAHNDNLFSQRQENSKKAYYAARSAVTVVEEAVMAKIEELKTQISIVQQKANAYNDAIAAGAAPAELAQKADELATAEAIYDSLHQQIMGTSVKAMILPNSYYAQLTHEVAIDSGGDKFDIDDPDTPLPVTISYDDTKEGVYRIESEATRNGVKGKAVRILDINSTNTTIHIASEGVYRGALEALGYIDNGNSTVINDSNAYYGENADGQTNGPEIEFNPSSFSTEELPEDTVFATPIDYFATITPGVTLTSYPSATPDFYSTDKVGKKDEYSIDSTNNGSYQSNKLWDRTYNVNTTGGNVILRFNSLSLSSNNVVFDVTGGKHLIIYIDYVVPFQGSNKMTFKAEGTSDVYLILAGDATEFAKNNITGNNVYVYASESTVDFKNGIGGTYLDDKGKEQAGPFIGAIKAKNIKLGNSALFTYTPPNLNNPSGSEGGSSAADLVLTQLTIDMGSSFWAKD